ncbi:MAG: YciI family protein [Acidimicrobiia bacterium]
MKYLLLIHQGTTPTPLDQAAWATLSDEEKQGIYDAYQAVNATPGVVPGNGLQPPETATTVRVEHGKIVATDGPFVDTKESINGYLVYEADDLDAAIALAAQIPAARLGGAIEVRPIMEW